MRMHGLAATLAVLVLSASLPIRVQAAAIGACGFNSDTEQFAGTVTQQALCLLRRVKPKGGGSDAQPLPEWLIRHIGSSVTMPVDRIQRYLASNSITEREVGSILTIGDAPLLRYFVIHDTSYPVISNSSSFPSNINESTYPGNNLAIYTGVARKVNLIVGRDGRSLQFQDWNATRPSPATKLEQNNYAPAARRRFVHVENVQPRIQPPGTWAWRAPDPGFSPAQEERLALAYVIASARAGRWLTPAFHFNIDRALPDGHDDPQGFNLASWVMRIERIVIAIAEVN